MPLYYHPKQGDVLLCDFTRGFVAPEMLKVARLDKLHKKTRKGREYFVPKLCEVDLYGVFSGVRAYLPLQAS